ncbi:hypothetical protein P692DRAFT_20881565 [Suillus brevipes Sb2]|nr:hypothetical protein P692DRAFT_20881565 [Suillus brevipes Sb2]
MTVLCPTYEELYQQLYRIFPISHNHYLSQLIFSPDASKASRILIGKAVHNAEEYNTRIAPLHRRWPNALLRFSIFDETPHKVPSATAEDSREASSPLSFMAIPPPPVLLSTPSPSDFVIHVILRYTLPRVSIIQSGSSTATKSRTHNFSRDLSNVGSAKTVRARSAARPRQPF